MSESSVDTEPAVQLQQLDACAAATLFASRVLSDSPDGVLLAQLSTPGVLAEWPLESLQDRVGQAELAASFASRESLQVIYLDHQRLFLGPERVLACPYESVYLNPEHLTFGSQTLAVREWYHRYGLSAPAEGREPDDHIGLELGFVSFLIMRALEAAELGDDDLLREQCDAVGLFVGEHLLLWAEECLDHVATHAQTHFYQGVGLLTRGILHALERTFDP
ncbi:MAG: molecular chaperone TorD family protein [Nocardioidaceae bacterium]